jgi:hypothetical protein
MAFDAARKEVVLFGGESPPSGVAADTWAWDGHFWTQVSDTGPQSRLGHVMSGTSRGCDQGKHCGRPFIGTKLEERIRQALAAPGRPGVHKLASSLAVGSGTLERTVE